MTPSEKNIVKSLIAVAWADGTVDEPEQSMIDGLLWAFGASDDEESELIEFSKTKRTLQDAPLDEMSKEDKEMLLANAALLTHADGEQTQDEKKVLAALVKAIGYTNAQAKPIISEARTRASKLAERLG